MSRSVKQALCFWSTPAVAALLGGGYFAAELAAGDVTGGVVLLVFSVLIGAAFALAGRRSETIRGLMDRRDERIVGIDLRATAVTGTLLTLAILIGAMVEVARGHSGAPYTWLAVVGAVGYVGAVIVGRVRR